MLPWDTVTRPLAIGGLGLKHLGFFQLTLLGPSILRLLNQESAPWVQICLAKYGPIHLSPFPQAGGRPKFSWTWRTLHAVFQLAREGFTRVIGDGRSTLILGHP